MIDKSTYIKIFRLNFQYGLFMNSKEAMADGQEIRDAIPISKNRVMSLDLPNFS